MKNKEVLAALGVMRELSRVNGLPIKFVYFLARNVPILETVEDAISKIQETRLAGQDEMEASKREILEDYAERDEQDKPITKPNKFGHEEYQIADWESFNAAMENFKERYKGVLNSLNKRNDEIFDLLEEESAIEVYTIDMSQLPVDMAGNSKLMGTQLITLMPFFTGELV
jgi:hypothetical protein